jgi:hypothetical protein
MMLEGTELGREGTELGSEGEGLNPSEEKTEGDQALEGDIGSSFGEELGGQCAKC